MIKYLSVDLVLNTLCNMNCEYCTAHTNDVDHVLDRDIYKMWIEKIHNTYPEYKINFILLGGELSLLPTGYIYDTVSWLNNRSYCGKIHIYTNCKAYSSEIHKCLVDYSNTYLRVSCDTCNDIMNSRTIDINEIIDVIKMYNMSERTIIDSTLNNFTIEDYPNMQKTFMNIGVNKFKFKYERKDALTMLSIHRMNKNLVNIDNIVNRFLTVIRRDCLYVDNFNLNTVLITELHKCIDFSIHLYESNDRTNRNILGKIKIPKELLWCAYE